MDVTSDVFFPSRSGLRFQPLPPAGAKLAPRLVLEGDDRVYLGSPPYGVMLNLRRVHELPTALRPVEPDPELAFLRPRYPVSPTFEEEAATDRAASASPPEWDAPLLAPAPSPLEDLLWVTQAPQAARPDRWRSAWERWHSSTPPFTADVLAWCDLLAIGAWQVLGDREKWPDRVREWDSLRFSNPLDPNGPPRETSVRVNSGSLRVLRPKAWTWMADVVRAHVDQSVAHALLNEKAAPPLWRASYTAQTWIEVAWWQAAVWGPEERIRLAACEECERIFLHRRNRAFLCPEHGDIAARVRRSRQGRSHGQTGHHDQPD